MLILPGKTSSWASSSYTENTVTLTSGDYLTGTTLPTSAQAALLFFSGTMSSSVSGRAALLNWDGFTANSGFYADANTTAGKWGLRYSLADNSTGSAGGGVQVVDDDTRCHILCSWYVDTPNSGTFYIKIWLYDVSEGTWVQEADVADVDTTDTATLIFTPDAVRLFEESGVTPPSHQYLGTVNRLALWTSTDLGAIADIDSSTVRDWFTSGSSTADPATSQANISGVNDTLQIDLNGPASDWNAGTHDGAMTLTPSGTFT